MAVTQRWTRPFDLTPGHTKKSLPTKYLALAARGDVKRIDALVSTHPEFLNKRGPFGRTLLWEATRAGRLAAVTWLAARGASIETAGAYNAETLVQISPLAASVHYRRPAIADWLRPRVQPADIYQASFLGDDERVRDLRRRHPDVVNVDDPDNAVYFTPPLSFAIAGGRRAVAERLLAAGAVVEPYAMQLLHLAASVGRIDVLELLHASGANASAVNTGTYVGAATTEAMRWLLEHGAPVDAVSPNRFPPLVYLARGDKGDTADRMQLLLTRGADVNARGPADRTALHYAAAAGDLKKVELLLAHGANVRLTNEAGQTAREVAPAAGKTAVAQRLSTRMP